MNFSKTLKFCIAILILLSCFSLLGQAQIEIDSAIGAFRDAIQIKYAEDDGIQIIKTGRSGVEIENAGHDGVLVNISGDNGFQINGAGNHGVLVRNAGSDGINVFGANNYSMNIQGFKDSGAGLSGHIAQIYNRNPGNSPDVLALKVGKTGNPGGGVNFITFYNGENEAVGRIEGNGTGGVLYGTSGGDFAECLPMLSPDEQVQAGDVVGVHQAKISLRTDNATKVMVITDRPAVLGNQQQESSSDGKVSFIGQVPVNVRGKVKEGDWIVASGLEDGTAKAVASMDITLQHQIVGRAWEHSEDEKIKKIITAIGLDQSEAKNVIIENMGRRIIDLQEQVDQLRKLILQK